MSLDGHLNTYQLAGLRWGTVTVKTNRLRDNLVLLGAVLGKVGGVLLDALGGPLQEV